MKPIKFISPSNFSYWENCPLRAIFSNEYKDLIFFPKHPDADLGRIIHSFYENKNKWRIYTEADFEEKWQIEINKLDNEYKQSFLQKVYFPLKWNSKYFAAKKLLLKNALLKEARTSKKKTSNNYLFEQWIDDENDLGGRVDILIINEKGETLEIIDLKTGNFFEYNGGIKTIKKTYIQQLLLYAYIIGKKQNFYPKCYIQDIKGNKFEVRVSNELVSEVYKSAIDLKSKINKFINEGIVDQLANPSTVNCFYCNFRPICIKYKEALINNFDNKQVDIYGEVIEIKDAGKLDLIIKIDCRTLRLNGISSSEKVNIGDMIYVFNLFCPDETSQILFAMKQTIIVHE